MLRGSFLFLSSLALAIFATTGAPSLAQPSAANACIALVRAAELPSEGLETGGLPSELRTVCESLARFPALPVAAGDQDPSAINARVAAYRGILRQLAAAVQPCERRCELLRRVLTSYATDRLVRDMRAMSEAFIEANDASDVRESMSRSLLPTVAAAVSNYDQCIVLSQSARLTSLEVGLRRRRESLDTLRAQLSAEASPTFPGTTCPANMENRSPARVAPTRSSNVLIVYPSSAIEAPLSETEHTRVVDAVRDTLARTSGLEIVSKADTEAIVAEARNGRALGREACAAPLTLAQAIEDARPDAIAAQIRLVCEREGCFVRVDILATNVVAPSNLEHLRARLADDPERVSSWIAAARVFEREPTNVLGTMLTISGQPAGIESASPFGAGLTVEVLRAALDGALPDLASCANAAPMSFRAVLDIDPQGGVRVVRRNDERYEGADCRLRRLEQIRFARGRGLRRAVVGAWANRTPWNAGTPSAANAARGVRFSEVTFSDARIEVYEGTRAVERVVVACDTVRATRRDPLAASITIAIDGTGHVTRASVRSEDPTVDQCIEAQLARLPYTCPRGRVGATLSLALCSFPP